MTQQERVTIILKRWMSFYYKGQADHDVRFLLRLLLNNDPDFVRGKYNITRIDEDPKKTMLNLPS